MELPKTHKFSAILADRTDETIGGKVRNVHVAKVFEEPLPEMGPEDVVLKMETCQICTTDYQQWLGLREHQGFPMAGGHEWSGIIIAKGENVHGFEVGDRVGPVHGGCGKCINCRRGHSFACTNKGGGWKLRNGFYGSKGFSNYCVEPFTSIVKLSNDLPAPVAGFVEPIATCVCGMRRLRVKPGETVVIIGAGTMGIANAQVAHAFGARVIITELSQKKLERARSMGFADVIDSTACDPVEEVFKLTDGYGADAVIAAVGLGSAYEQGYKMLKRVEGRFLLFAAGYPVPEWQINPNEIHYRRIEIIGTMSGDVADFADAAYLISHKLVDPSFSLEGKLIPLKDIQEAFIAAATPDAYRVTVDLQNV
ncbi:MAG: zinc-binding dehydrogenase [Clostridia bacterium]|jgi:L-iditol 2-dehydrogenase|nr:zinc-binding dehydrogenase [Clostridia bacterium]